MTPISPDQYETFCFTCGACTGKPWVSLTDDEIIKIVRERGWGQSYFNLTEIIEFTGTIEAELRSKNT